MKKIEAYLTEDGQVFIEHSQALKHEKKISRIQFVSMLRELERQQHLDKKKMSRCVVFGKESEIREQSSLQQKVKMQSKILNNMYKVLSGDLLDNSGPSV
jgi:hypothetical protein